MYQESYFGIEFSAPRGDTLTINASSEYFYLAAWGGVLNLMSKSLTGRTAVFLADCEFFTQGQEQIVIKIAPGTPSYMKELDKLRPVSNFEHRLHRLGKLW